ncbi:MAG: DUF4062 domain-containing protein [Acidobacteria bacterium]|nr:DUF4062 domain-containing protein [Acidobacteriota bacterium]
MLKVGRTFRVFVSSTFSDMKAERAALQEYAFPRLKDLCHRYGCRFQAIDLRWGISEEAGLDQQTMNICLNELRRCQTITPRPNFIIMLGDRYGWQPLPLQIPAVEFEEIMPHLSADEVALLIRDENSDADSPTWQGTTEPILHPPERSASQSILPAQFIRKGWYRRDDNAVPAEYVLQPRRIIFPENIDKERHEQIRAQEASDWNRLEIKLCKILRGAVEKSGWGPLDPRRIKYEASATHQEILEGALSCEVADLPDHMFAIFRRISNLPDDGSAPDYADFNPEQPQKLDNIARTKLEDIKRQLRVRLGSGNVWEATVAYSGNQITTEHLKPLCEVVYERLAGVIRAEIKKFGQADPVDQEASAHARFAEERQRYFVGRVDVLDRIRKYLQGDESHPLIIHGMSGCGKSALMAKSIHLCKSWIPDLTELIVRFIGATPASASTPSFLESLCREISVRVRANPDSVPVEYRDLIFDYPKRLALATAAKPLVIFVDALDQLPDTGQKQHLQWIPQTLPPFVKMVLSVADLPSGALKQTEDQDFKTDYLSALRRSLPEASFLEVPPLPQTEREELLNQWLEKSEPQRQLQPDQRKEALAKFTECPYPLYMKLVFEEARRWKSFDQPKVLSSGIPGILEDLFTRLEQPANHGRVLVSRTLGYLTAARYGLTEDELLEVLSADEEVLSDFCLHSSKSPKVTQLPVSAWCRLYAELEPYLIQRESDGAPLIAFFHRDLSDTAARRYLQGRELECTHTHLARYFAGKDLWLKEVPDKPLPISGFRTANARKVRELPYHQIRARMWRDLDSTLTALPFLEAKCAAGMALDLLGDYQTATAASANGCPAIILDRFRQFEAFVRSEYEVISRHPELTFQQAANQESVLPATIAWEQWKSGNERRPWLQLQRREFEHSSTQDSFVLEKKPIAAAISHDGERIGLCAHECVTVYEVDSRDETLCLSAEPGQIYTGMAMSPKGDLLAIAIWFRGGNGLCQLWRIRDGTKIGEFSTGSCRVLSLAFCKDTQAIAFGGSTERGGKLGIYQFSDFGLLWERSLEGTVVRKVVCDDKGRFLIAAQGDGICSFWDIETGDFIKKMRYHTDTVMDLCTSPDGSHLATAGKDGYCRMWNLQQSSSAIWEHFLLPLFRRQPSFSPPDGGIPVTVAILDESRVLCGNTNGNLFLWDSRRRNVLKLLSGEGAVTALAISGDGAKIAAASDGDRTCRIINARNLHGFHDERASPAILLNAIVSPPELMVIRQSGQVQGLALGNTELQNRRLSLKGHIPPTIAASASVTGRFILAVSPDSRWTLLDCATGDRKSDKFSIPVYDGALASVSPDGRILCLFCREQLEFIFLGTNERRSGRLSMVPGAVRLSDEGILLTVGVNSRISQFPPEKVIAIAFNPNSKSGRSRLAGPFAIDESIMPLEFSIGDTDVFMVSGRIGNSNEGIVEIWDIQTLKRLASRKFQTRVKIHGFYSSENMALISIPGSSTCHLIDASSGGLEDRWILPYRGALESAVLQRKGRLLAVSYRRGDMGIFKRMSPACSEPETEGDLNV